MFLGVSFIPGMPEVRLDPDLVLPLVLAPLLYSAGLQSSPRRLRENLRPIGLLAVGLVLFTAFAVGVVAWWFLPGLPLVSAFILGAIIAPPDAVAAASIGRRLGLQRRVMAILEGESLLNDATALTLLRIMLAAAGVGAATPSVLGGLGEFVLTAVGGVVVGAVIGWLVHRIRLKLDDAVMESALGLVIPFATYVLAEDFTGPSTRPACSPSWSRACTWATSPARAASPRGCRTRRCGPGSTPSSRRSSSRSSACSSRWW